MIYYFFFFLGGFETACFADYGLFGFVEALYGRLVVFFFFFFFYIIYSIALIYS